VVMVRLPTAKTRSTLISNSCASFDELFAVGLAGGRLLAAMISTNFVADGRATTPRAKTGLRRRAPLDSSCRRPQGRPHR